MNEAQQQSEYCKNVSSNQFCKLGQNIVIDHAEVAFIFHSSWSK